MFDLFEFEAVLDAEAGAVVAEPGDPGAVQPGDATSTSEPEAAAAVAETATPAWAPTQDDWQSLQQELGALRQAVTPAAIVPTEPDFANYFQRDESGEVIVDLANLKRYIDDSSDAKVNAKLAEVTPVLDQTIRDRGEQVIQQQLERLGVPEQHRALARDIAEGIVQTTGDPQAALKQAAQRVDAILKAERDAAVEEYKQTLGNVGNAPRDGSANGSTAVERTEPRQGMNGYRDVENSWIDRNGRTSN